MKTRVIALMALALATATATGIVAEHLYSDAHRHAGDDAVRALRDRATDGDCSVDDEQWPLGPRWGRTCRSAEWQGFSS